MALVEIDTIGALGVIRDDEPYKIDPAAWSDSLNVRFIDGYAQSIAGREEVFGGTLSDAPQFLIPISTGVTTVWVWASLTKAYVQASGVQTEITRAVGGNYSAVGPEDWNGIPFAGILVLNNGYDIPQSWAAPDPLTDLTNLPNWPSTYRAKVMRALGPYLVAANITVSGANFPHRVKWSHAADPGSVPDSWDYTDPEKDAGESELPDVNSGGLVDALNLRGQLFLYKESATWRMRHVGGQEIFAFDSFLDTSGILAPRCVALVGDGQRHFVATQDDIVIHNGNEMKSVMERKFRRYLFSRIDATNYRKSFAFANLAFKEMWFCYPTIDSTLPNMAVIWNWETGAISETEVRFVAASSGPLEAESSETWADAVGAWSSDPDAWSDVNRRSVLVANPLDSKILQLNSGNQFDGQNIETRLQRTGIALTGRKRDGSPIVNFQKRKMVTRVFPRVTGGPVDVRIGAQDQLDGPVRWTDKVSYNPASQRWVDTIIEGAALAIEFSSQADVFWRLEGYKLEMDLTGDF